MITKHLRKATRFFFLLVSATLALGCEHREKEAEKEPSILRIQADNLRPNALQTTVQVTVSCDIAWSADLSDKSWAEIGNLVVKEGIGGSFTLTLSPNTGQDPRETVVKVTAGKGETTATITQEGLGSFFEPSTIMLAGTTETKVTFVAPNSWTAEIASGQDWITLLTKSGTAGASVLTCRAKDDNKNVGSREGAIRIKIGTVSVEIPVVQNQKDVILGKGSNPVFQWKGGTLTVHTQSNVVYEIDCGADWIVHTETRALNEATEIFVVKPNDDEEYRMAEILFTGGDGATLSISVLQDGKAPFLNITKPGFYGVAGKDYVYGEEGWNQAAYKENPDGSVSFRLMNRAELSVISLVADRDLSDIDNSPWDVVVTLQKKGKTVLHGDYHLFFDDASEDLIWLSEDRNCYFILKR